MKRTEQSLRNGMRKTKTSHFISRPWALKYGQQDDRILAKACLAFHAEIMGIADVDPWISSFILAGLCSKIFWADMLEDNTIGLVPANGYNQGSKFQSLTALRYLHWIARTRQIDTRTAFSIGGEERISGIGQVDGYCAATGELESIECNKVHSPHVCISPSSFRRGLGDRRLLVALMSG